MVTQRRGENRQADQDGREAGLSRRPRREHDPAVARVGWRYSPNGLNGFGLVETITLFVSR